MVVCFHGGITVYEKDTLIQTSKRFVCLFVFLFCPTTRCVSVSIVDSVIIFLALNSACYLMVHFMRIHTNLCGHEEEITLALLEVGDMEQIIAIAKQKCM